ncbi:MAG: pyridoxamine 5'-phosphate oxidase, partial [Bdellovibrionales bacterium]|nr:pyridoxamine 5'-phosphate oxidase [Bdellovibrionales bacterium]
MGHLLDSHCNDPWVIFRSWYDNTKGLASISSKDKLLFPFRYLMKKVYPPFLLHGGDAMSLATCSPDGNPSSRVVLFKEIWDGGIVFYTNYNSRKSQDLLACPQAALCFHWALPERQVRLEGRVEKVPPEMSDHYWASRPRGSQIGGWASDQSQPIADRSELITRVEKFENQFRGVEVPRPPHWGGFVLRPAVIEFW